MSGGLTVIGLGPGAPGLLAPLAREALVRAQVLVGYGPYLELVEAELLQGKEIIDSGMTREMERVRAAVAAAASGKATAIVCSGDSGVYGLAGLAYEILEEQGLLAEVDCEVIPGIPAVMAAAALLGAPLVHDFACVSLSDLLTPWEVIEKRLEAAAAADFVLAIYNPRSRRRHWQLPRALAILAAARSPETPVGLVRNAYRPDQSVAVGSLAQLDPETVDMLSLLVVGNSSTKWLSTRNGEKMVTPRGYFEKYAKK